MKRLIVAAAGVALALSVAGSAAASPATDTFGKCLVESSTGKDRIIVMQWFFAVLSVNPNVQTYAAATPEQRQAIARQAAGVLQRLVLTDCRTEAVAAIKSDGSHGIQTSFEVFGRMAATELITDPAVQKEMNAMATTPISPGGPR